MRWLVNFSDKMGGRSGWPFARQFGGWSGGWVVGLVGGQGRWVVRWVGGWVDGWLGGWLVRRVDGQVGGLSVK